MLVSLSVCVPLSWLRRFGIIELRRLMMIHHQRVCAQLIFYLE